MTIQYGDMEKSRRGSGAVLVLLSLLNVGCSQCLRDTVVETLLIARLP
jgi:hypothetical protein